MRTFTIAIASSALLVAVAAGQCALPNCHMLPSGDVYDGLNGPFLSGHVYVLQGVHQVPPGETLTVQPGAIIKFPANGLLPYPLEVSGNLQAVGTAAQPILWTSIRDDTGGDTDGTATPPAAGDWKGLVFHVGSGNGAPHALDSCIFAYGGRSGSSVLDVLTSDFVMTSSIVTSCDGPALGCNRIARVTVGGCWFNACTRPTREIPLDGLQGFTGNFSTSHTITDEIALSFAGSSFNLAGNATWNPANTMNGSGVVVMEVPLNIIGGASLTIDAGMIVKWASPSTGMTVSGTLTCNGSASSPIVFASKDDDAFGGDTFKNGGSAPGPGSWGSLTFGPNADASILDWVVLNNPGGNNSVFGAIDLAGADITMTNCAVVGSALACVHISAAAPIIDSCFFLNGQQAVVGVGLSGLAAITNNFAAGNTLGDYLEIGGSSLFTSVSIGPANALATPSGPGALVLGGNLFVGSSATLTVAPGTIIKSTGPWVISIDGTLDASGTPAQPIVFTSFADDHGGDTNNAPTSPMPGDWEGLKLTSTSTNSTLANVIVRYAGTGSSMAAVALIGVDSTTQMTDCTVEFSSTDGLSLFGLGSPVVSGCAFDDNRRAVVRVPFASVANFTGCTASGNTMGDYMGLQGGSITGQVLFAPQHTLNTTGVFVLAGSLAVGPAGRLELAPNTVIKIDGDHSVSVDGEIACPVGPAWVTSLADDTGGDTDNAPNVPAPGDWGGITLQNASLLENVTVRYGGSNGAPSITLIGTSAGLDGVKVEHGAGAGVVLASSSAQVTNCAIDFCDRPSDPIELLALQNFSNNTATGNTQGDFTRFLVGGGGNISIGPTNSFNGHGTFIADSSIVIPSQSNVCFLPGTVIKFSGPCLVQSSATLQLIGAPGAPVVFTSINDDAWGIDTNGAGPAAQPGEWVGFAFTSSSGTSVLQDVVIRFAGAGNPAAAAVDLFQADIALYDTTIEKCAGTALHANQSSTPIIQGCTFICNGGKAIDGITWGVLGNTSGLTAYGNAGGNDTVIDSPVVAGHVKVSHDSYLGDVIIVNVSPTLVQGPAPSNSLSFGEGVIIKCGNPGVTFKLNDESSICGTAAMPVVITSIHDDTIAGDTNQNGGMTTAIPGDWGGIDGEGMNGISYLLHRYGGSNLAFGIEGAMAPVVSTRVEFCAGASAFYVKGTQTNCVAFGNLGDGFNGGGLRYCTAAYNGGTGMKHGFINSCSIRGCNSWANSGPNIDGLFYGVPSGTIFYTFEVVWSNGITPLQCGPPTICPIVHYTTDVDPMFVDGPNGDLRLASGSPLRDVIPLISPNPSFPMTNYDMGTAGFDVDGNSRQIDSDGVGPNPALSDVGAHEAVAYHLDHSGLPQLGATLSWMVNGPPGDAIVVTGLGLTTQHIAPYGYMLAGDLNSVAGVGIFPVGSPVNVTLPAIPQLAGFAFVVQALAVPYASPAHAEFTNTWKATIFP